MATKTPPATNDRTATFWAVRYIIAVDEGKPDEAALAQKKLLAFGFEIDHIDADEVSK
jgi:hypothetical protein